jgi:hypothetical protein
MKKFTAVIMSAFVVLTMLFIAGCESETENQVGVIGVDIISPVSTVTDSVIVGATVNVTVKLTGFTFEYQQINYYFGDNMTPAGVYSKDQLNILAASQEKDAEFTYSVSTIGLEAGINTLTVEAVSNDLRKKTDTTQIRIVMPSVDDTTIDIVINSPANNTEFRIGDNIPVVIGVEGNLTMFDNLSAYLNDSTTKIHYTETGAATVSFSFPTVDFPIGPLSVKVVLKTKEGVEKTRLLNLTLIEYIPTFTVQGEAGYELKGLIQTFDKGYLAVSSSASLGTKIAKYNEEGQLVTSFGTNGVVTLAANIGIGESVCEDSEYDKGYVIAGWRQAGAVKNTWVRKINHVNGSLIWNKTYGFNHCNDGATVIKKSVDDGYVIGGWTENYYGTGPLVVSWIVETPDGPVTRTHTSSWETGLDVRLLKIYSNGNEVWGHNVGYVSHIMWNDISLHKETDPDNYWVRKMGDQMITDLIAKEDGNYLITGSNNWYLYGGGTENDMFFAEVDNFGGFVSTMTWSRMSAYDMDNMASEDDEFSVNPGSRFMLNYSVIGANHLGDLTENEASYSFVESHGGYGGQVVMAGETYQRDSKAKLYDAWVVEFGISADEDGALWENAFGDVGKDDKTFGIDRTRDGGYILTGYSTRGTNDRDTWLFKLDGMLKNVWSVNLGVSGTDDFGAKVLQTSDGGFIIGGNTGTGTGIRSKLIKVNKTGQLSK